MLNIDPDRYAPIFEAHCERIVSYLRDVGGIATRAEIRRECRVPKSSLVCPIMQDRLAAHGVISRTVELGWGPGHRRAIYALTVVGDAC